MCFFRLHVGWLIIHCLLLSFPLLAVGGVSKEVTVVEHASLMYQHRYSYVQMLFSAIARHTPNIVGSVSHKEAEKLVKAAKALQDGGDVTAALIRLNEVILLLETLSSERPLQVREEGRYLSLIEGIPFFVSAHRRHFKEALSLGRTDKRYQYSQESVDALMAEADVYSKKGRFGEASVLVQTAQERIAAAIKSLLDHKQVGVVAHHVTPSIKLGRSQEEIDKESYENAVISIKYFKEAHLRQAGGDDYEVILFDKELVEWLLSEAESLALEGRYPVAIEVVKRVRGLVTKALRDTLDGQDIVVKLDISTPELEFAYESRRYLG